MPTPRSEAQKIVARARRIGWDVETGGRDWLYRITCPPICGDFTCTHKAQLHSTPSDRRWMDNVFGFLNRHGFEKAEDDFLKAEVVRNEERAADLRRKNDAALELAQQRLSSLTKAAGPYGPQVADLKWIFSAHELEETRRLLIPPELSKKIVDELNTSNRPLRLSRVRYWAKIIKKGGFKHTHQGIAFNTLGRLQDGQHRLTAAAHENYTLDVNVSVGMPVDNFGDIDTGFGRTGTDAMAILEKDYPNTYSSAAKLIMFYNDYGTEMRLGLRSRRVPPSELVTKSEEYGDQLESAVALARQITSQRDGLKLSANALAAGIYLIREILPEESNLLEEFLRGYAQGTNLQEGDVRIAFRSFSFNLGKNNRKISVEDQFAVVLKAWNAFVKRKHVSVLTFNKTELMPKIVVPNE